MGRGCRVTIINFTKIPIFVAPIEIEGMHQGGSEGSDFFPLTGEIPPDGKLPTNKSSQYLEARTLALSTFSFKIVTKDNRDITFVAKFYKGLFFWKAVTEKEIKHPYVMETVLNYDHNCKIEIKFFELATSAAAPPKQDPPPPPPVEGNHQKKIKKITKKSGKLNGIFSHFF